MSWPEILIAGIVVAVGVPAAFRNPTAAALVIAWTIAQGLWLITGDNLPLRVYIMTDIAVIAVIICKPLRYRGPYRGPWHQLQCIFSERLVWDRIVLAIFPVMWTIYILNINETMRWWLLYWLLVTQFLAAGGEALSTWLAARKANAGQPVSESDDFVYHGALGRMGGG